VNLVECWFLSREECDPYPKSELRDTAKKMFIDMVEESSERKEREKARQRQA